MVIEDKKVPALEGNPIVMLIGMEGAIAFIALMTFLLALVA